MKFNRAILPLALVGTCAFAIPSWSADRNDPDRATDMTVASRGADVPIDTGRDDGDDGAGRPNLGADRNIDINVPGADVKINQD
jgi:hypothetical protein